MHWEQDNFLVLNIYLICPGQTVHSKYSGDDLMFIRLLNLKNELNMKQQFDTAGSRSFIEHPESADV